MEELKTIFFITLRVPTLRFGGSFFLYLTFYSNPFWRGVIHFGQLRATLLSLKLWSAQYISDWVGLMDSAEAELRLGQKNFSSTFSIGIRASVKIDFYLMSHKI